MNPCLPVTKTLDYIFGRKFTSRKHKMYIFSLQNLCLNVHEENVLQVIDVLILFCAMSMKHKL